ncbi:MAG TPA: redoxin domain-containing protein [Planctomycetota bacterium]|nr:redoxin domain-containing protein [Planctomycetota bacterium]
MRHCGRCAFLLLLCGCASAPPYDLAFTTLDAESVQPLRVPPGAIHVLLFVQHECPIANSYAPEIAAMARDWRGSNVRLFLVHVDPRLSVEQARQHAVEYELPAPIVLDPHHVLVAAVGAAVTPEAAVLTERGLQYRGRIDDQWGDLGKRSQQPQQRDLRAVVQALQQGRPVPIARTNAVGCLMPEPAR